jgi:hypothetical protein
MAGPIKTTRCSICKHDDRARIELLSARGASRRHIGERFNCSPDAVWRHWRNGHVPEHVKSQLAIHALKPGETLEKLVQDESIGLLENLQRIRGTLYASFDSAAEVGDRQAVSLIAARLHENLRLAATSTGELQKNSPTSVTNIVLSPAYLDLRAALLRALRPYPDAARAVVAAFHRAEAGLAGPVIEAKAIAHAT